MSKRALLFASLAVPMLLLPSCSKAEKVLSAEEIVFYHDDIVTTSFGGLGVEWGAYEDTDKLAEGGWERILRNLDRLNPTRVRLMISYDWICTDFDNKGTSDKTDDTWSYNFTNKWGKNVIDMLTACQIRGIDVAFGAWNVIANLSNDVWGMLDEVTSDIRWAKITKDVLSFLVKDLGFTCIKWFVNSNEPNYVGNKGSSKNANNTYAIWEQGVKNVRAALDAAGLNDIGIIGGDTTGFEGSKEYLYNIARNMPETVGDYGVHLYISNYYIDRGTLYTQVRDFYKGLKEIDPGLGVTRQAEVWEGGLLDGKNNETDCNGLIETVGYGVRMADYTIQLLAAGLNSIVYWDFDDAMHFMYGATVTPKEWGMFSSLAEATASKKALRPWFHSSTLLTNLLKKGNVIYGPGQNDPEFDKSFRSLATLSSDKKNGGFLAVNQGTKAVKKTFVMEDACEADTLYYYEFNTKNMLLDEEGFIKPNAVFEGSLNKKLTLDIPVGTLVVVSTEKL